MQDQPGATVEQREENMKSIKSKKSLVPFLLYLLLGVLVTQLIIQYITKRCMEYVCMYTTSPNININHTKFQSFRSAMASSLESALYKIPSLQMLCHHCRRKLLPITSQKRHFITRDTRLPISDKDKADIFNGLEELSTPPSSSSDFAKSTSATLGLVKGLWSKQSGPNPPAGMEIHPLSRFDQVDVEPPPHHLHVYSTRHNCHITLSDGKHQPLISVSSGNIGFRKGARGSYDAAFQLGAYVMGRIKQQGLLRKIDAVEVILRDFGPGRDAFTKILTGSEGRLIRDRVVRVMDGTRVKFGGTRSRRPRRL